MSMAKTITISVDEESDRRFRKYAETKYGRKKGALSRAYKDMIAQISHEDEQERIRKEAIAFLNKGIKFKRRWKFNRDELHER